MDKSWMQLGRSDPRYIERIKNFFVFVEQNFQESKHKCPCSGYRLQKHKITRYQMYSHLIHNGMMRDYTTWTSHGEVCNVPSLYEQRQQYRSEHRGRSMNSSMKMVNDAFRYLDRYKTDDMQGIQEEENVDHIAMTAYEKYQRLVAESQNPLYDGSRETVLGAILKVMRVKGNNEWFDKSFDDHCKLTKYLLPPENKYHGSYQDVRKILKNIGLGYEVIHACEYGYVLFYDEYKDLDYCPKCGESRYMYYKDHKKIPKRVVQYFPLTPRLQRLYMSSHTAKIMQWHGERLLDDEYLRHPADGEA